MSHVKQLTHIVFATQQRLMTIDESHSDDLYRYINAFLKDKGCYVYCVNGIENHIHILVDIHPRLSLSDTIRKLKRATALWMRNCGKFPDFNNWCREYYACSISPKIQKSVENYISNQKEHHKGQSMENEFIALVKSAGIDYDGYILE